MKRVLFFSAFLIFTAYTSQDFQAACSHHFNLVSQQPYSKMDLSPQVDSIIECVEGSKSEEDLINAIYAPSHQPPEVFKARLTAVKKFRNFLSEKMQKKRSQITPDELVYDFFQRDFKNAHYLFEDNGYFVRAAAKLVNRYKSE